MKNLQNQSEETFNLLIPVTPLYANEFAIGHPIHQAARRYNPDLFKKMIDIQPPSLPIFIKQIRMSPYLGDTDSLLGATLPHQALEYSSRRVPGLTPQHIREAVLTNPYPHLKKGTIILNTEGVIENLAAENRAISYLYDLGNRAPEQQAGYSQLHADTLREVATVIARFLGQHTYPAESSRILTGPFSHGYPQGNQSQNTYYFPL